MSINNLSCVPQRCLTIPQRNMTIEQRKVTFVTEIYSDPPEKSDEI